MADAFKKIRIEEVKLTPNELDNGLTLSTINHLIVSAHAKKRGRERFDLKNDVEVDMTVREALKKAKYVGLVPASDGNESHLFAHEKMGIHVSKDYKNVNTLVPYGERYLSEVLNNYSEIKDAIIQMQLKEMRKLNRKRKHLKKKVIEDKLNNNIEIAELERKMYKSKSEKAKKQYLERKVLLCTQMQEQERDLEFIDSKLRKVGGSLAYLNK
jgi:hypothetical protein